MNLEKCVKQWVYTAWSGGSLKMSHALLVASVDLLCLVFHQEDPEVTRISLFEQIMKVKHF